MLMNYPDPFMYYDAYLANTVLYIVIWICFFAGWVAVGFLCARFVYRDAKKTRGMPAQMWALIAFFLGPLGLLIYLLMKNAK